MTTFANGKHLVNYILKIINNSNYGRLSHFEYFNISKLDNIYDFIESLPENVKNNLNIPIDTYKEWIRLAQNKECYKLAQISLESNDNIEQFKYDYKSISFDEVFTSFELGISYKYDYLTTKPEKSDIYYPHFLDIVKYEKRKIKERRVTAKDFWENNNGYHIRTREDVQYKILKKLNIKREIPQ